MLEFSQVLLFATTIIIAVAFGLYVLSALAAKRTVPRAAARPVAVGVGATKTAGAEQGADTPSESGKTPAIKPGSKTTQARGIPWFSSLLVVVALLSLTLSVAVRWIAAGEPPLANQYEFATAFAWGMILFQIYFERTYKVRTLGLVTLPVILAMLIYVTTLSSEKQPLMPALQNSPLLTLHVFTAALAYGAAVVGFGAAVMYLLAPHISWQGWPRRDLLDEIAYKAVVFTFPLLTIMIVLGAVWANIAWGRYWAWDPKETSALVTWLIYGAYIHARVVRNWRGNKAAWLLVLGFLAVIFTFFGNLWFGGLHSYL
ncbi:MAG: cytochrome c biogenesis protein CcsA [Actinomycetaceae bacterium]|nr:cytochrome c biogenesis protein CcsA [Actinomycetaceae bacterium]